MSERTTRERLAVLLCAVVTAVVFTWPLAMRFGSAGRVDSGDGRYSIWNVAWVAHALTSDARLFDANIFHPNTGTLAYSEANLFAGAIAVPVWRLTGNPHAASNWTILCAFALAFLATYALVRRLTGSVAGAFVAATAFAFCPYVFAHLAHVQLLQTFGLPLVLLALHGFVERPAVRSSLALGLAMALAGLACGYYGVFAGLMAGAGIVWFSAWDGRWRRSGYWLLALGAAAAAALIVGPFFVPFMDIRGAGFERSLDEARLFSVGWREYFASARLIDRWMLPLIGAWREVLFPGFPTLVLAGVAVWGAFGRTRQAVPPTARSVAGFYLALAGLSGWASLGPDAGLYALLHETVPLFALLRAPARFGVLVTLALAVLAGFGTATLVARASLSRRRTLVWTLVTVSLVGSTVGPLPLVDAPPVNPVHARLAGLPRAPVVEFPYFSDRGELHRHTEYMLMSTYHWQPLVNGYSDHTPADALDATPKLATFPGPAAWEVITERRVRYVVLHWHIYADAGRPVREAVTGDGRLHLMLETPRMSLYQVVEGTGTGRR
jgi:hypothetical protein